jgi:transposase InsO family protein
MDFHANHALGLPQRLALVQAIEAGTSQKAAAAAFCVAPATAHRWWHRWRNASAAARASLTCLLDRSSRPRHQPRLLASAAQERVCAARRKTGLGPGRLAGLLEMARSTIWKVLHRHGLSRRPKSPRTSSRRFEWSEPGALLHIDTARLPRFERPGHRVRGRTTETRRDKRGWGSVFLHAAVDDHTRYAYVEQHPVEDGATSAAFLRRAVTHFAALGLAAPQAVMTDNAFAYTSSRRFKAELSQIGARHIRTPAYTPRWNGKVERFIQTLKREWAYAHAWPNSTARARALPSFLRYYNRRRPHSSLGDRAPISRIHNLRGQDS